MVVSTARRRAPWVEHGDHRKRGGTEDEHEQPAPHHLIDQAGRARHEKREGQEHQRGSWLRVGFAPSASGAGAPVASARSIACAARRKDSNFGPGGIRGKSTPTAARASASRPRRYNATARI